ncbi:MAG: hypothetical protein R3A51_23315 [Nannocystaceae bacterium]
MKWTVQKISAPTAFIKVVDEHGNTQTLAINAGKELVLDLEKQVDGKSEKKAADATTKAPKEASTKSATPKVDSTPPPTKTDAGAPAKAAEKRSKPTAEEPKRKDAADSPRDKAESKRKKPSESDKVTSKETSKPKKTKTSSTSLAWRDEEHAWLKGKTAAFGQGHWAIVKGNEAHVLLYAWPDGTIRDVDAGTQRYVMDVAQFYVDHGVAGHASIDAFLDALKRSDAGLRPSPRDLRLTWTTEQKGETKSYKAVIPELGRVWIEQVAPRSEYMVLWKPTGGGHLKVAQVKRLTEAKTLALHHARKVIGLAGDRKSLGHGELVWKETREDGRTVCMCAIDDGHLELIELKTGSFALFHVVTDDDWTELGAGTKNLMMKKARAYVEERSLEAAPEPAPASAPNPEPEPERETPKASTSDAEKTKAVMGSLDELLAGVAEAI